MKKFLLSSLLLCLFFTLGAQKYMTQQGYARFYSDAPLEKIEAKTYKVSCALDIQSGEMVFKIPMTTFTFRKPLMQRHFNENYIESHEYPYAYFKGKVMNADQIQFSKDGSYTATVAGELTLHGVTQQVQEEGSFQVEGDQITGKAVFTMRVADYKIKVPRIVFYNIAEEVEVSIEVKLEKVE